MDKRFDLIVWDWDGTLSDSTGMITQAIVSAAEHVGLKPLDPKEARNAIGLGVTHFIRKLYGEISTVQAQELAKQYRINYFAAEHEIPLVEGAKETIIELNKRGHKVAVATGKGRRGLDMALARSGISNYLHATKTVDECFSKPHPQMLDELMDELVVLPNRTLMIGDSSYDLQMAQNAEVASVGVTFGAQSKEKLLTYNPIEIFDEFSELSTWLLENA